MRSVCLELDCPKKNQDKNKCIPSCEKIKDFQKKYCNSGAKLPIDTDIIRACVGNGGNRVSKKPHHL